MAGKRPWHLSCGHTGAKRPNCGICGHIALVLVLFVRLQTSPTATRFHKHPQMPCNTHQQLQELANMPQTQTLGQRRTHTADLGAAAPTAIYSDPTHRPHCTNLPLCDANDLRHLRHGALANRSTLTQLFKPMPLGRHSEETHTHRTALCFNLQHHDISRKCRNNNPQHHHKQLCDPMSWLLGPKLNHLHHGETHPTHHRMPLSSTCGGTMCPGGAKTSEGTTVTINFAAQCNCCWAPCSTISVNNMATTLVSTLSLSRTRKWSDRIAAPAATFFTPSSQAGSDLQCVPTTPRTRHHATHADMWTEPGGRRHQQQFATNLLCKQLGRNCVLDHSVGRAAPDPLAEIKL